MPKWTKETYVFDPRPNYPLRVSVSRYRFNDSSPSDISGETSQLGLYAEVRGAKHDGSRRSKGGGEESQLGRYAEVAGAKAVGAGKGVKPGGEEGSQLGQYAEVRGVKLKGKTSRNEGLRKDAGGIGNETSQVGEVTGVKSDRKGEDGREGSQLGQYAEVAGAKVVGAGKSVRGEEGSHYAGQTAVDEGLTLVMAHGTGFTKESWEPTLEDLVDILQRKGDAKVKEVWSVEAPNHGDSAALNEDVLKYGCEDVFGWEEYARVLHLFLTNAGSGLPQSTDFSKSRLVGVGHSMGAAAVVLTMGYYPQVRWDRVVLCDLMCMPERFGGKAKDFLVQSALRRRDTWKNKLEALESLAKGRKRWDRRVLENYVEYGLKEVEGGVGLKCSKVQEAACYKDPLGSRRAYVLLPHFAKRVQTHMIYGEEDDQLPAEVKDDIRRKVGEALGSWARVPGAGHLIPQMNPRGLAEKLADALQFSAQRVSAKL